MAVRLPRSALRFAAASLALFLVLGAINESRAETPDPIDPTSGQLNLLDLVNSLPINDVQSALDHFPVPYVVCASAGGATPTCVNQKAGSPQRLDADRSKTTGKGGDDIQVEVNTELVPSPHLRVNINRITSPLDATDVQVIVAFPFAAFNGEPTLPAPNLFLGYQTTNATGGVGGKAPLTEEFRLTPHILAGTSHNFTLSMLTGGQVNPMRFVAGHFDGTTASGIQNAIGMQAYVQGTSPVVPNSIAMTISMEENAIGVPLTDTALSLNWTASSPAKVVFDYLENESFPITDPDYNTTLTFDQMPMSETISLSLDEAAGTMHLTHTASAPIGEITLLHERTDGLVITGTATDVPTFVDLAVDLSGALTLDVNANTLDIDIIAQQEGGFFDTADFLGYNLGYAEVFLVDAPDLQAGYIAATNQFGITATNSGESIGALGFVIGDDEALELPARWGDSSWHEFSLIDDGTHGTAAARVVDLESALLSLDSSPTGETFEFILGSRSPMELHLETTPASALTGEDILAVCEIVEMPEGDVDFTIDFPDQFDVDASPDNTQVIDSITCSGHVGTLNFELGVGHLPMNSGYKFDANGKLEVLVEPSGPNSDAIGFITVRLWDEVNPLPSSFALTPLLGPLHDARMRADTIPSFVGTWSDGASTAIDFHTGVPDDNSLFVGGVQVSVSTIVELIAPLHVASPTEDHYVRFADEGASNPKRLAAGVFGLTDFSYASADAAGNMVLDYAANAAHALVIAVDTRFSGLFFPDYDIDATFTLDSVPATFHLDTNLRTELHYSGSAGIDQITLVGDVDISPPAPPTDKTHVNFLAQTLPATVDFSLDPATGATLTMSAPIDLISLELTSDVSIFGSDYKHIKGSIEDIPANWTAAWGTSPNIHASLNTSSPLGPVSLVLSKDVAANTPSKYNPFTVAGGAVQYTPFAREMDLRYFSQGAGDDATREGVFMGRLDGLYNSTSQLDPNEDHVITRQDGFISIQGTGFQCISAQVGPGSFQCVADTVNAGEINASLLLPVAGVHPLYVAIEQSGAKFMTVQVPDVPDSTSIVAGLTRANLDFSGSPGDLLIYNGPLPSVGDFGEAFKMQLIDTPSFVHASWNFGFPGGVTIDSSNEFELRLLTQDGSGRTVVDLGVGDLSASWGVNTAEVDFFECKDNTGFPLFIPFECGTWLTIVEAFANFTASPGIEGFIANYVTVNSPMDLSGTSPAKNASEYVPRLTAYVDNFTSISGSASIDVCLLPSPLPIPFVPCLAPLVPVPHIGLSVSGDFNFDFWDLGGGPLNFLGDPDYVSNDPWDLYPFAHSQDDHLFPFGP